MVLYGVSIKFGKLGAKWGFPKLGFKYSSIIGGYYSAIPTDIDNRANDSWLYESVADPAAEMLLL